MCTPGDDPWLGMVATVLAPAGSGAVFSVGDLAGAYSMSQCRVCNPLRLIGQGSRPVGRGGAGGG